jgi:hypothetical protein
MFFKLHGFGRITRMQCGMRDCFDECLFGEINKIISAKQSQNRKSELGTKR